MEKNRSYPPINALVRGLEVLSHISAAGTVSVNELHKCTGIPKPTIIRNLETLEHAGYVTRHEDTGRYMLTARVLNLSSGYNSHRRLVQLATPIMNRFRKAMPWPSDLAVFDTDAIVIIETNRDPGALALNRSVGTRLSITESALGRAYLAFCDDATRQKILKEQFTEKSKRTEVEHELKRYREQGFSENDRSLSIHTRGIGVPIMRGDKVEACINTIVLAEALSMSDVIARCVPPLREVAMEIANAVSNDLGHEQTKNMIET